jgi:hypothetical protein
MRACAHTLVRGCFSDAERVPGGAERGRVSTVATCLCARESPAPADHLPPWRPTKSHPADFILKQIINSDARRIGWSARGLDADRDGAPDRSARRIFVAAGDARRRVATRCSHATALTLSSSAGVVAEARWESARKAAITKPCMPACRILVVSRKSIEPRTVT